MPTQKNSTLSIWTLPLFSVPFQRIPFKQRTYNKFFYVLWLNTIKPENVNGFLLLKFSDQTPHRKTLSAATQCMRSQCTAAGLPLPLESRQVTGVAFGQQQRVQYSSFVRLVWMLCQITSLLVARFYNFYSIFLTIKCNFWYIFTNYNLNDNQVRAHMSHSLATNVL